MRSKQHDWPPYVANVKDGDWWNRTCRKCGLVQFKGEKLRRKTCRRA